MINFEEQYKKLAKFRFFPYFVCALAASFYLYEFAIRVSPSVMTNDLMASFHIQSFGLGALAACFFYVYTPMQIPAGILVDRYGPRFLLTTMMLLCVVSSVVFAKSDHIIFASFARAAMGFASAFVFISILVLISRWCPPKQFAMLAGYTQLLGAVGAIAGQVPLTMAVAKYGWRNTMLSFAVIGTVLAVLMWIFIRDYAPGKRALVHRQQERQSWSMERKRLRLVIGRKQTWWIGIYSFSTWAAIAIFPTLWGVHYLHAVFNVSTEKASGAVAMAWVGVAISSPVVGWWSDQIGQRRLPMLLSSVVGFVGTAILFYCPDLPFFMTYFLLLLMGLAAGGQTVAFGVVKDINPASTIGTAYGFNNLMVIIGAAIFQPLVGAILQMHWMGVIRHGVPVYSSVAYHEAMLLIPLVYVAGFLAVWFGVNETNCQPTFQKHHYHLD